MGTLVALITWALRIAGLVSAAEKIWAAYHPSSRAEQAQKAVADEDHREIAIAAAPPKSVDAILDRMQRGED